MNDEMKNKNLIIIGMIEGNLVLSETYGG